MARTAIPIQVIPGFADGVANIAFTAADAVNDHEFENVGDVYLLIKNDDASPKDVDVVTPASSRTANAEVTKKTAVAATSYGIIGPFDSGVFTHPDGTVHVDIASATSLSFAAVRKTPAT